MSSKEPCVDLDREERVRIYKEQRRLQLAARTAALMSDHVTTRKPIRKLADHPLSLDSATKSSSEVNLSNKSPPNVPSIRTTKSSRLRAAEKLGKLNPTGSLEEVSATSNNRYKPSNARGNGGAKVTNNDARSKTSPKHTTERTSKICVRQTNTDARLSSPKSYANFKSAVNRTSREAKEGTSNGKECSSERTSPVTKISKLAYVRPVASESSLKKKVLETETKTNGHDTIDKTKNTAIFKKNLYRRKNNEKSTPEKNDGKIETKTAEKSPRVSSGINGEVLKMGVEVKSEDVKCEVKCGDARKKSIDFMKVNSFSELLNSSSEEVDVQFEQILAENGIGEENLTLRPSLFTTSFEMAVASPVQIVEPLHHSNGGPQKKRNSSKNYSEDKTDITLPNEKHLSKSLTNSPARRVSTKPNRSPVSPHHNSSKKNGRGSLIPTANKAPETNIHNKTVKSKITSEKDHNKKTDEQDKRLNSLENKKRDNSHNDTVVNNLEEAEKSESKENMSLAHEEFSTKNMRFSQRVDDLAEFTKRTLDRVDKLASKTNSTIASSENNTILSLSEETTSNEILDKEIRTRGVNERLQDIEAAAQRLIDFERQNAMSNPFFDLNNESSHNSSANNIPVSILKRKSINEDSSPTPPVTFSPSVVEPRPSRQESRKQGILKKRCSLDESQVSRQRSCSPEVSFADDAYENNKPILKNRRSSLEDVIRSHSPDGHIQGILKRRTSKDDDLHIDDASLGSPEPHGILKKKSVSSSSSSTASSHVSIAQAVILAAASGAELIDDDSTVRPILKKKSFSEERTCPEVFLSDQPKPILKKKTSEQDDCDKPKKPILKTRRCEEDGSASSFDLSEDDRSSRRPSLLRSRTSDQSDSETSVRPILKQRANSVGRDRSESPHMRLSFYGDSNENNPIVNYLTEIHHEPTAFDSLNEKNYYPSDVLRRRNQRPKPEERAQSVVGDTDCELFTILNDRRMKVDRFCATDSYQENSTEFSEEKEIALTSVADRIKDMENSFHYKDNDIVERKNRKNRSNGRFSTQPITIEEMQLVTDSLDGSQNPAVDFRLLSNTRIGVNGSRRPSVENNWRETSDLLSRSTDLPNRPSDHIEALTKVVDENKGLIELSEEAFDELERTQIELQRALERLEREEDERSLSVSCDSGVYNRRNGDEAGLTEPSTTESDPASLEMSETRQSASPQEDDGDGGFLGGLVRSNSVSARASMWQALQEQQAKAVSRPPLRHGRSKNKENADRFRSQQIVWRGTGSPQCDIDMGARSRSLDVDDEAKLDEDDPAKMSLMEKMKLFNSKLLHKPPVASAQKATKRNTMSVLDSHISEAKQQNSERQHQSLDSSHDRRANMMTRSLTLSDNCQDPAKSSPTDNDSDEDTRDLDFQSKMALFRSASTQNASIKFIMEQNRKNRSLDEPEKRERASLGATRPPPRASMIPTSSLIPKPLSKGDSTEGLKDEGIDSSSDDDRDSVTSSDGNSSTSPEPSSPFVAKETRQKRIIPTSKTDTDITRLKQQPFEDKTTPVAKYRSPFGDAPRLKPTTDAFVRRGLLKKQNSTDCDLKLVNVKSVLSPDKRKFFGLDDSKTEEKPPNKEPRPDFSLRWCSSGTQLHPASHGVLPARVLAHSGHLAQEASEGSDGDSSGGREIRRITGRRKQRSSSGVGAVTGPAALQRSATHGDVMPQRGGTIADRLAALQAAGANEWKNRVCRISPENDQTKDIKHVKTKITEQLTQGVDEKKKIQVDENEVGRDILADRRSKLENASQEWRRRVPEKDADALTVQARLQRRAPPSSGTTTPTLTAIPPAVPAPSPFKSRRLQEASSNGFGAGPLRSASCAVVGQTTNGNKKTVSSPLTVKSTEKFKRSQSVSEDIAAATGENKKKKASSVVTVPRADDETFSSFYSSVNQSIGASANAIDQPKIDVDLDAIQSDSVNLLVSSVTKRAKATRKVQSSRNPLRALQERADLTNTYTEHHTDIVNNLSKSSSKPALAAEALAALAAREDFSSVSLRSVNHNQHNAPNTRLLLHIKGRRRVQTRLVEPIHTNINRGDCFVLVCPDKVFNYVGLYSNVIERSRAKDIALHIHTNKDLGCANSSGVITLDESKTLNKQQWQDFWSILGANNPDQKPVDSGNAEEDEIFESSIIHTNMCYELIDDELVPIKEYWGQVPRIAMLNPSKVIVFDFGSEMFVWNGKNVPLERRRLAANLAQELFDQGYDYSQCNINPLGFAETVGLREEFKDLQLKSNKRPEWAMFTKVTQHMESVLFREKFLDWPDFTRVIRVIEKDPIDTTSEEIVACDVDKMIKLEYEDPDLLLEGTHLGRGSKYYDKETMRHFEIKTKSVQKWFVQDNDYQKIENESELPVFYTGDSYILRWEYQVTVSGRELNGKPSKHTQTGRDRFAYFCWQGKDASPNEKGTAALLTVELDKEKGAQMRVVQGSEPPAFLRLFNGDLVIRQGKKADAKSQYELFVSRGCVLEEAYLLQVVCSARQLRARTSHVLALHATRMLVVRHGARTRPYTREIAEELAKRLAKRFGGYGVKSELEGHECSAVRTALGVRGSMAGAGDATTEEEDLKESPRLWQFTDLLGKFEAVEILSPLRHEKLIVPYPFEQKELYGASQPAMLMLDDGSSVWVWQGWWPQQEGDIDIDGTSSTGEFVSRWLSIRQASMETALDYARTKYGGTSDVHLVFAGLESDAFTQLFDDWVQNDEAAESNMQAGYKPSEVRSGAREFRSLSGPVTLELAALQQRPLPPGLSPQHLEKHLATPDFIEAFGMSPDDFAGLPAWKQTQMKKDLGLF